VIEIRSKAAKAKKLISTPFGIHIGDVYLCLISFLALAALLLISITISACWPLNSGPLGPVSKKKEMFRALASV